MNAILKSLLWKEWQEQKWKLAALTGLLVAVLLLLFTFVGAHRGFSDLERLVNVVVPSTAVHVFLGSIFVAMTIAGGENSRRTMAFLQSLPVPLWQAAAAKLVVAMVTLLTPILVVFTLAWLIGLTMVESAEESHNFTVQLRYTTLFFTLSAVSLLVWVAAGGNNRPDEVSAGAIGFLTVAAAWLVGIGSVDLIDRYVSSDIASMLGIFFLVLPGTIGFLANSPVGEVRFLSTVAVVVGLLAHGLVIYWFLVRFGRVVRKPNRTAGSEWDLPHWPRLSEDPWRTQVGAVAWKQFRETGPLAILAASTVTLLTAIVYWSSTSVWSWDEFGSVLAGVALTTGFLVVHVAGIGVLLEDYKPGVSNFWRSRPVCMNRWFPVQYLTGIVVLIPTYGPVLLVANWWSGWPVGLRDPWPIPILAGVVVYSLSLATYAVVRQPIFSIALTVFLYVTGMFLSENLADRLDITNEMRPWAFMLPVLALTVTFAYLAVKHDWGWKR